MSKDLLTVLMSVALELPRIMAYTERIEREGRRAEAVGARFAVAAIRERFKSPEPLPAYAEPFISAADILEYLDHQLAQFRALDEGTEAAER